jgi:predicted lipid-binding transport protein (Tim44 family)
MNGKIDLITLIALIVAVVAILKLRSVLGRRTSDDEARYQERIRAEQMQDSATGARDKVVALPNRGKEAAARPGATTTAIADVEERIKGLATNREAEEGLMAIARADRSFDPLHFMDGAKQAYEMIVTAFAEGNKKILKDLLSREVYEGFEEAISGREARGEQIDQAFVGINKADIIEAELKGSSAQITIKFISQLISATRDRSGEILSGDAQRITEVTDIWSFSRDVQSGNPNWRLVATQAAT